MDEADLVFSYGHDEDITTILSGGYLPKVYQSFLMSATMTKDVEKLKGLVLRNPVCTRSIVPLMRYVLAKYFAQAILRLEEDEEDAAHLSQYAVRYGPLPFPERRSLIPKFVLLDATKWINSSLRMLSSN